MLACLSCFSVFKSEMISRVPRDTIESTKRPLGITCPTMDCMGQVIDIDEVILPTIFVLQYKGYTTRSSCAGHVSSKMAETYVMFEDDVELSDFPHGFEVLERVEESGEDGQPRRIIRKVHESGDRIGSILLANKKLYDWARGLPNLNDERMDSAVEIEQRQNELLIMRMLAMGVSPYKQNIPSLMKKKAKKQNGNEEE